MILNKNLKILPTKYGAARVNGEMYKSVPESQRIS